MMQISNNKNSTTAFILTLVFPFGGLIYSLSHWRESWAKNIFWLACIYLGAVLIFMPEGTLLGDGADGGRYVLDMLQMRQSSTTLQDIFARYLKDPETMDLYFPIVALLVSSFTDNGHVLFAVFAIIFGFFYSRNIWYILEKLPNKKLGNLFILVSLYFLVCPITQINGVRMWTALHVFVYALMPYLLERDRSKMWLIVLCPFIHFSFLYVSIFAVFYFLLPYKLKTKSTFFMTMSLVLFVGSMLVNSLNLDAASSMLKEYSPESYEGRINAYSNQDYAEKISSVAALDNWYVAGSGNILYWSYNILLIALLPCIKRNFNNNDLLRHLYVFALLLGAFANISALIPSGGRFQILSQMFKVPLILLVAMNIPKGDNFRKYVNVALVFLLIPFVVELRKLLSFYSITAIFGNFVTVFFWENNVPLITFIKRII